MKTVLGALIIAGAAELITMALLLCMLIVWLSVLSTLPL